MWLTILEHKGETNFRDDHEWIVGFKISLGVPVNQITIVILVALMLARIAHTCRICLKKIQSLVHIHYKREYRMSVRTDCEECHFISNNDPAGV